MRRATTITGAAFLVALALAAGGLPLARGAAFAETAPAVTITPAAPAPKPAVREAGRPLRILVFGDSLSEGYGLPAKDGLVAQLQRWLDARDAGGHAINAGLTGDTSYGGRIRIKWALRHRPDAVIVELGANDFLMGWALPDIEKNLDSVITQAKAGGRPVLLVGIAPPRPMRGVESAEIAAMWHRLADRHDVLLLPDLYAPVWRLPAPQAARLLQEDGLHLSAEGVARAIEDGLGAQVLALIAAAETADDGAQGHADDTAGKSGNDKDRAAP